ncbi:hypothetical protein M427DRAFT_97202 [Gonapodya prolifera JEL478]|uniref:Beta-sandwich domain of Sec23/24 n=1 Tax=Gonapodya prolifera (strain JEL478) TaxID=1344416 RepID=A0A139AJW4_GONPJ|nr:hypothetical protein M427DRAFT_97202 [Gonapodya prolifera JEL478]|eukprot:KXS17082.1 hypothetical protein M427DRAFT_97202 [Gonapodya prolifera JEL478]
MLPHAGNRPPLAQQDTQQQYPQHQQFQSQQQPQFNPQHTHMQHHTSNQNMQQMPGVPLMPGVPGMPAPPGPGMLPGAPMSQLANGMSSMSLSPNSHPRGKRVYPQQQGAQPAVPGPVGGRPSPSPQPFNPSPAPSPQPHHYPPQQPHQPGFPPQPGRPAPAPAPFPPSQSVPPIPGYPQQQQQSQHQPNVNPQYQPPNPQGFPYPPRPPFPGPFPAGGPPPVPSLDSLQPRTTPPSVHPLAPRQPVPGTPGTPGAPGAPPARQRIDPNQIPSPVAVHEADQQAHAEGVWLTSTRQAPPLVSTECRIVDDGNSSPRLLRLTTANIPSTPDLSTLSQIPIALLIQPLADPGPGEDPVPLTGSEDVGPERCNRCHAYVNPFVVFLDGGRRWLCNICGHSNPVSDNYFSNLDMHGRRLDLAQRPELTHGTVEFVATKEYALRPPAPLHIVFAIDVSYTSVQSGHLARACEAVRAALPGVQRGCRVGVVTYDKAVQFYNMKPELEGPQMLVVSDVHDVFVPINEGFLGDVDEARTNLETLLDTLPTMFETTRTTESVLGAAVQAVDMALAAVGGRLLIFQSSLANAGPGALSVREDTKLLGTDQEKTMFQSQDVPLWKKLGTSLVNHGVCVDMWVVPGGYVDLATIGTLAALTGGSTYYYQGFDYGRDGPKFVNDVRKSVEGNFGYDAVLRVRCSTGLRTTDHFGNFNMSNSTDVQLAGVSPRTSLAVAVQYDSKLDEKADAFFQVAMLYTTAGGNRRIRILNAAVPVTSQIGNVFRYADMDTTVNYLMKTSATQAVASSLRSVREALTDRCVKILASYRKNCASSTQPGQLILPESYKLYPLYNLSLLKMKAFRGGPDLPSDVRVYHLRLVKGMPVTTSVPFIYPRIFALHDVGPLDESEPFELSRHILPPRVRASYERMDPAGLYLVENGQAILLWIGRQAPPEILRSLFGVDAHEKIDVMMRSMPELDNALSVRVRTIVGYLQSQRTSYMQLQLVRQQADPLLEVELSNMLAEDKSFDGMNYVDYLTHVHRLIQTELAG